MLTKENTKDWMKAHPVSNLPGRIRPSADGLKYLFEQRLEIAQALAEIAGVRNVTTIIYEGMRHEILNEDERAQPMGDILTWIEQQL